MLKIKDLHSYYGAIEALKGIDMNIEKGKITCLVGNNGAGKSTLLKSISGMLKCTGSILYDGEHELVGKSPIYITKKGIAQVPEGRHVFPGLTVEQNLETGTISWHGFFGRKPYDQDMKEVFELFPRMEERRNQYAWSLSGGEQQMLAVGRALMARPDLLMLDEPSMGLAPKLVAEVFEKIVEINRTKGITVLLVEQNARSALRISDYAYVIENGHVVMSGTGKDLMHDERVINAYLGMSKKK